MYIELKSLEDNISTLFEQFYWLLQLVHPLVITIEQSYTYHY
jgi:hypothetical protein